MQSKISSFFKPSPSATAIGTRHVEDDVVDDDEEETDLSGGVEVAVDVSVTYTRRTPKPPQQCPQEDSDGWDHGRNGGMETGPLSSISLGSSVRSGCSGKLLNKKRSYAQYHLEFGQSDFLLHTCSGCGMAYTCGDESDEKVHKVHHKNYHEGVSFKGWHNEREIPMPWTDGQRVILVLDGDPPFQKRKVQQVLQLMERDLSLSKEWLLHKLCKVFLFISRCRIVACLIAEPIMTAHRVIPWAGSSKHFDDKGGTAAESAPITIASTTSKNAKALPTVLRFGNATFYRESNKKSSSKAINDSSWDEGVLLCSEESEGAVCGVRAIWVVPSLRRCRIATRLLDAARKSFVSNSVLETYQCAFSQPTSSGRAFAASYSGTPLFLVYKSQGSD